MYLVFLLLILATLGFHFFPEWSPASIALAAPGCVVVIRLALGLSRRRAAPAEHDHRA